jgi:zinc protease
MRDSADPLLVHRLPDVGALAVYRQAPPPGAASGSISYVSPAGWGFDPAGARGVARLVSRLVTSAAGPYARIALARRLDRLGATLTPECAPESSEITIWGPGESWRALLDLLAEVVLRPRFDAADIARVRRQAIEGRLREQNQPGGRAELEFLRAVFPAGHPYRETGRGDVAGLRRISRSRLIDFHREYFSAEGARLVATVPASASAIAEAVGSRFRALPAGRGTRLRIPPLPRPRRREVRVNLPGRAQVEVRFGGPTLRRSDPGYAAAVLANEVLGGRPLLSRLFQRLREQGGLAYGASSSVEAMRWGGYWVAHAGTGPDRWPRVVRLLRAESLRLAEETVRRAELDRIRESAIGQLPLSLESTAETHELAVDVAYHDLPEDHWRSWPAQLRAVRPAEVRHAAETALDPQTAVTVLVGPLAPKRPR